MTHSIFAERHVNPFMLVLCLLLLNSSASGQYVSPKQAIEDLTYCQSSIETYQPAWEVFTSDFEEKSRALIMEYEELWRKGDSVSVGSVFNAVSQLCVLSKEGHFSLGKWEDDVHRPIDKSEQAYLPLILKVMDGRAYVRVDRTPTKNFEKGTEVVAINGRSMGQIMKELYAVTPSDGNITGYKDHILSSGFGWRYALYVEDAKSFNINYRMPGSHEIKVKQIQAYTYEQQIEHARAKGLIPEASTVESSDDIYVLKIDSEFAYLRLKTFNRAMMEKYDLEAKSFYKDLFANLKEEKVRHLIIDLRSNGGGLNDWADEIVPYIQKDEKRTDLLKTTISWKGKRKKYSLKKPSDDAFQGKLYVLIDEATYSAGSTLARYLKEYGDAEVIGRESGTRYEGFAAGSKETVVLPHSKFEIGIPRYLILYPASRFDIQANRGVLPDVDIPHSIQDWIEGADPFNEYFKRKYGFAFPE